MWTFERVCMVKKRIINLYVVIFIPFVSISQEKCTSWISFFFFFKNKFFFKRAYSENVANKHFILLYFCIKYWSLLLRLFVRVCALKLNGFMSLSGKLLIINQLQIHKPFFLKDFERWFLKTEKIVREKKKSYLRRHEIHFKHKLKLLVNKYNKH